LLRPAPVEDQIIGYRAEVSFLRDRRQGPKTFTPTGDGMDWLGAPGGSC
jgi:hypothetical protein